MPPNKESLQVLRVILSRDAIARALMLTGEEVVELFRDARLTGRLAEVWGERLFRYTRHTNSNFAGSDGRILLGPIGRYDISVRAFSKSIKFQQSKFMGSGRSCSQDDLIHSLENVETMVVVDLREFPAVSFYPLNTKSLLRLAHSGRLTPGGMSAKRFDAWIAETFAVSISQAPPVCLSRGAISGDTAA
jgi:hypothetical protein